MKALKRLQMILTSKLEPSLGFDLKGQRKKMKAV